MNQILQQMLEATSIRSVTSDRIQESKDRITISGDCRSSLIAEIKENKISILISHGLYEPTGLLTLLNSEIETMNTQEESMCLDAFDYGLDLLTFRVAIKAG